MKGDSWGPLTTVGRAAASALLCAWPFLFVDDSHGGRMLALVTWAVLFTGGRIVRALERVERVVADTQAQDRLYRDRFEELAVACRDHLNAIQPDVASIGDNSSRTEGFVRAMSNRFERSDD